MSNKLMLIAILLCGTGGIMHAENTELHITIPQLFQLVDQESKLLKVNALAIEEAEAAVAVAKSERLPSLNASLSLSYLGNGYLTDRDFSNGTSVEIPHFGNNFAIEAIQSIYTGGAISNNIKIAELKSNMASLEHEKSRQDIRFIMLGQVLNLYKLYNYRDVLKNNISTTQKVIEEMQARYRQGIILKNDITRYELQLSDLKLRLSNIDEAIRVANFKITNSLELPEKTNIIPEIDINSIDTPLSDVQLWYDSALSNNYSLRQAETGIKISKHYERLEQSERIPKISLFASSHFDGPITIEVPAIDKNFNYWCVGVNISYNISSLFKTNKKLRQAKANTFKSKQEYELAVESVTQSVQSAHEKYKTAFSELNTRKINLQLAQENYNVVANQYKNGMAIITDMIDADNVKLSAELDVENAIVELLFCQYRLKYLSNTL